MIAIYRYSSLFYSVLLIVSCADLASCQNVCPLWHIYSEANRHCECCTGVFNGPIRCEQNFVYVVRTRCMTWNEVTHAAELSRCLVAHRDSNLCDNNHMYSIPSNVTGPELNDVTCKRYNRQGAQCRQCIDGYGPAAFSDGVTCADCSKYKHLWVLNLFFQLIMVTIMYL